MPPGPYTYIRRKAENALEKLLDKLSLGGLDGVDIFKGLSASELTVPRIGILCETAEPEVLDSLITGNWHCEMMTSVISHISDLNSDTHADRCGIVEDIIMRNNVADHINDLPGMDGFHVFGGVMGWMPGPSSEEVGEDFIATIIRVNMYCAPSLQGS
jgi:hypothetical protein